MLVMLLYLEITEVRKLEAKMFTHQSLYCFFFRSMEKQKNLLLEAYAKNGIAKCKLAILEKGQSDDVMCDGGDLVEQIDLILTEMQKFIDIGDSKVSKWSWLNIILREI